MTEEQMCSCHYFLYCSSSTAFALRKTFGATVDLFTADIGARGRARARFGAAERIARLELTMKSLPELQELTGYSRDQLKRRLALLRELGRDGVHRGAHGALLVPDDLVQLLVRMAEQERKGLAPREALALALESAEERCSAAEERAGAPTLASVGAEERQAAPTTSMDVEFMRLLWALFGLLAFATAGMLGLGIAALLTR